MELRSALDWTPPDGWNRITVVESHTGGEPFRVVIDGLPDLPGDTILERRRFAMSNLDHLRRALMWEPRGHADMYGGWLGEPTSDSADLSVLFMHNEGFSTMCGHGIIALAKVLLDTGVFSISTPETALRIETPAGVIESISSVSDGRVTETRFRNVPSFVADLGAGIDVEGLGTIDYDLAFGGAFYAIVDADRIGLSLDDAAQLTTMGRRIKEAISSARPISHPDHDDLGFLYGVIFTGAPIREDSHSRNVCVFADGEVDRSPTGTGVSARLAILHARGEIGTREEILVESIVGSRFAGSIVEVRPGDPVCVVPEISGTAHITGRSELWHDPSDTLGRGFLVR